MPMDIEEFEAADADDERPTAELIVEFLLENREAAFTRSEIADAIDRDPNTVGTNLSRLKDRGLLRHRKQHWAITQNIDRVIDDRRFAETLRELEHLDGSMILDDEDAEAWVEAQPDVPHPSEQEAEESGDGDGDERRSEAAPNGD